MFETALTLTLRFEGGYANDPADPGGATNKGITQATYTAWLAGHGFPPKPVVQISDDEVAKIYKRNYWLDGRCDTFDTFKPKLAIVHFDAGVNHGLVQAAKFLQRAVETKDDGVIGPVTIAVTKMCDEKVAINRYLAERHEFYNNLATRKPAMKKFLRSWLYRLDELTKVCT